MKTRLEQAGLLNHEEGSSRVDISLAWRILSRLGCPARYGGKAMDGSYEYVILHPQTGHFLATGKGITLEGSMCEAALNASRLIDTG